MWIEANPRASRTTFIAKAHGVSYSHYATKVMLMKLKCLTSPKRNTFDGFAIKEPVFSF